MRMLALVVLSATIPATATAEGVACGGHNIIFIGGRPPASAPTDPQWRQHGPPTVYGPGMSAADRVLWDALVFDAHDHPVPMPGGEDHWRSSLSVEERHTLVMDSADVASFNVCIQSADESYTGERLRRYADPDWWREQVRYFTGRRWNGTITVDTCSTAGVVGVPSGWVYVREGEPGEVDDAFLAQATSWYLFDPHGTVSTWVKSEILWHSAEKVRRTDETWIESSLAHELGHVLGFSHVDPASGFVMLHDGRTRTWPETERRLANLAYVIGPGVEYPGFIPAPVAVLPVGVLCLLAGLLAVGGVRRLRESEHGLRYNSVGRNRVPSGFGASIRIEDTSSMS